MCYCSKECQRKDWPNHKITCGKVINKINTDSNVCLIVSSGDIHNRVCTYIFDVEQDREFDLLNPQAKHCWFVNTPDDTEIDYQGKFPLILSVLWKDIVYVFPELSRLPKNKNDLMQADMPNITIGLRTFQENGKFYIDRIDILEF
jgi:hypothetical protein